MRKPLSMVSLQLYISPDRTFHGIWYVAIKYCLYSRGSNFQLGGKVRGYRLSLIMRMS